MSQEKAGLPGGLQNKLRNFLISQKEPALKEEDGSENLSNENLINGIFDNFSSWLAKIDEADKTRDRPYWFRWLADISAVETSRRLKHEYFFMAKAFLNSRMTNCLKAGHGSVIVHDRTVISDGYNGVPRGVDHPAECARLNTPSGKDYNACPIPCLHSETNAIYNAARIGARTEGATIYISGEPCLNCAEALIQAGIIKVVFASGRGIPGHEGLVLLFKSGITLEYLSGD